MTTAEPELTEKESRNELQAALQEEDGARLLTVLKDQDWEEQRRTVSRLSRDQMLRVTGLLGPEDSARLLRHLAEVQAVDVLDHLPASHAAAIVEHLSPELASDLLRELDDEERSAILAELSEQSTRVELKRRIDYPEGCAGSLMRGYPLQYAQKSTVGDVLADLEEHAEEYSDRDVQYLYVTDSRTRLVGVLRLRDLVLSRRAKPVEELMIPEPVSVRDNTPAEALMDLFQRKDYLGLPVVSRRGRLLGMVPRDVVEQTSAEEQAGMFLQSSGIVNGEELRSMGIGLRCRKRLTWLAPNIILNLVSASVIAANEDTLEQVIALAVFLPIVSDMSGCSGNQAVAVSIRELTLGLLRPVDFMRVVVKEGMVGVFNGLILGLLLGTVAALWKGNVWLGVVVALALALNTIVSVLLGGLVPLILKRFKVDPALASGPILTTCTDMCGFFLVLSSASVMLDKLV